MNDLRGRVVLITGASAGIGRAAACEFARQGAKVGLVARGVDGLRGAQADVERLGGSAHFVSCDVSDHDALARAADEIEEQLGPIDVWVNDAFTNVFCEFRDIEPAEFRRATEVSYFGFVYGTQIALKKMQSRDRGTIVQVGSALAYRSIPLQAAYCGAKSAIRGFTDSIRCELLHQKSAVRITMVQMPALNTPQFSWCKSKLPRKAQPVPPIFQPEVAGRAIAAAARRAPRELWVGFSAIEAIVGQMVIPGLLDRYLGKIGYDAQMTGDAQDPEAPYNLWEPLAGDRGARGSFDDRSADVSPVLQFALHPGQALAAVAALAGLGIAGATALATRRR